MILITYTVIECLDAKDESVNAQLIEEEAAELLDEEGLGDFGSDADVLLDSMRDPIIRLYKVSTWIRSPSSRFASAKALHHREVDPDTDVDLFQAFEPFDADYVRSIFKHYQNKFDPGLRKYSDGNKEFLLQRIALANVHRRRQFAYWRKHREKLSKHSMAVTKCVDFSQPTAPTRFELAKGQLGAVVPLALSAPSITTASHLNISQLDVKDDQSAISVTEYAPSLAASSQEVIDFPPPPKQRPVDKFFECPYCFTICSTALLNPRAWK